jgi:hypothetical protein
MFRFSMGLDFAGSGSDQTEVISRNLSMGTKEKHDKLYSQ